MVDAFFSGPVTWSFETEVAKLLDKYDNNGCFDIPVDMHFILTIAFNMSTNLQNDNNPVPLENIIKQVKIFDENEKKKKMLANSSNIPSSSSYLTSSSLTSSSSSSLTPSYPYSTLFSSKLPPINLQNNNTQNQTYATINTNATFSTNAQNSYNPTPPKKHVYFFLNERKYYVPRSNDNTELASFYKKYMSYEVLMSLSEFFRYKSYYNFTGVNLTDINIYRNIIDKLNWTTLDSIYVTLLNLQRVIFPCVYCRIHYRYFYDTHGLYYNRQTVRRLLYLHDKNIQNQYIDFEDRVQWILKLQQTIRNRNNSTGLTRDVGLVKLRVYYETVLSSPEDLWEMVIMYALIYPYYADDLDYLQTEHHDKKFLALKLYATDNVENDLEEDWKYETNLLKRTCFNIFLIALTALCAYLPNFQNIIGYFWPIPNEIIFERNKNVQESIYPPQQAKKYIPGILVWLITRQWQWYYDNNKINILLLKLLPKYQDIIDTCEISRTPPIKYIQIVYDQYMSAKA